MSILNTEYILCTCYVDERCLRQRLLERQLGAIHERAIERAVGEIHLVRVRVRVRVRAPVRVRDRVRVRFIERADG